MSSISLLVNDGKLTLTPGKLTCLLEPSLPPSITSHKRVSSSLVITLKFIRPLSTEILEPSLTDEIKSL